LNFTVVVFDKKRIVHFFEQKYLGGYIYVFFENTGKIITVFEAAYRCFWWN